jgi:hypothetical protein
MKFSADAKVSAEYPSDLMRPFMAARMESSSSTIEIKAFLGTANFHVVSGLPHHIVVRALHPR